MINFSKLYYFAIGLFFQGARLYRIELNLFTRIDNIEAINEFEFYMPVEKDMKLFEKIYENIPGKIEIIKKRFKNGNYRCFAYHDKTNNRLAYTRWICLNSFYSDAMRKQLYFKPDEALTLDSYTHPDYRFKGLHKNMNIQMLQWLKANTPIQYVYMVIFMFIPHLTKIPIELGYKSIEGTFYYKKGSFTTFMNLVKHKINV